MSCCGPHESHASEYDQQSSRSSQIIEHTFSKVQVLEYGNLKGPLACEAQLLLRAPIPTPIPLRQGCGERRRREEYCSNEEEEHPDKTISLIDSPHPETRTPLRSMLLIRYIHHIQAARPATLNTQRFQTEVEVDRPWLHWDGDESADACATEPLSTPARATETRACINVKCRTAGANARPSCCSIQ